MKRLILLAVCFAVLVGCSQKVEKNYTIEVINGIKVYKNSNKPSAANLVISPGEIFRIGGLNESTEGTGSEFTWPHFLDIDSNGNIYIVDSGSSSIKKFDKNGTFIKSFGSKGHGPGEMIYPFMVVIQENIVFVADPGGRRIVKFDTDGNFINNIIIESRFPGYMQAVGSDKFICFRNKLVRSDENPYRSLNLVLVDTQFREIATLQNYKIKFDPRCNDFLDLYTAYAVGKDEIFVGVNGEDQYKINVFDFNGKLLYSIEKEYQKVTFSKMELDELNNTLEKVLKKFGNPVYIPVKSRPKKAINIIYYDKEDRLLVASSIPRDKTNRYDFMVDVFKDGVFLKKIKLDIAKGYDFLKLYDEKMFFKGGRIFHLDAAAAEIKVFQY